MADIIMKLPERTKIQLLAPVVRGKKGRHEKVLERARKSGYVRVLVDGSLYELSEDIELDKNIRHTIEIVVDRLVVKPGIETRLSDSIENVLEISDGLLNVDVIGDQKTVQEILDDSLNPTSKMDPDAVLYAVFETPGFIDVFYVNESTQTYYGLNYLSDVATHGKSSLSTEKPDIPGGVWYTVNP
jgi:excinuclease UvrABC ATPase subunit